MRVKEQNKLKRTRRVTNDSHLLCRCLFAHLLDISGCRKIRRRQMWRHPVSPDPIRRTAVCVFKLRSTRHCSCFFLLLLLLKSKWVSSLPFRLLLVVIVVFEPVAKKPKRRHSRRFLALLDLYFVFGSGVSDQCSFFLKSTSSYDNVGFTHLGAHNGPGFWAPP